MTEHTVTADTELQPPNKGSIYYHSRGNNQYATFVPPLSRSSNPNEPQIYLGKVVNKEEGLFYSVSRGFANCSPEKGYIPRPDLSRTNQLPAKVRLQFGDIWIFQETLRQTGFSTVMKNIFPEFHDTLNALVAFKLCNPELAYVHAQDWFDDSYVSTLYPKASVSSGAISAFLAKLGEEHIYQNFTTLYLDYLVNNRFSKDLDNKLIQFPILLDSTGLPNAIQTDKTMPCTKYGATENEIHLIYAVDQVSGLPIYYKAIARNIPDISMLNTTLKALEQYGISIKMLILDAGYTSLTSLNNLNKLEIPFITRMKPNFTIYKEIISKFSHNLPFDTRKIILQNGRIVFCEKHEVLLGENKNYAYLCFEVENYARDITNLVMKSSIPDLLEGTIDSIDDSEYDEMNSNIDSLSRFMLISNEDIPAKDILKTYYTRQRIEQIFDISKNNGSLLPLRTHSEETFRGHLLITFITTILTLMINKRLEKSKLCSIGSLKLMSKLFVTFYDNYAIIDKPNKQRADIIDILGLETNLFIDLSDPSKYSPKRKPLGRPKGSLGKPLKFRLVDSETLEDYSVASSASSTQNKDNQTQSIAPKRPRGRPKGNLNKLKTAGQDLGETGASSVPKLPRGRPKGSLNKLKTAGQDLGETGASSVPKRPRGRPKGSLNKPKPAGQELGETEVSSAPNRPKGRPKGILTKSKAVGRHRSETEPNRPKERPKGILTKSKAVDRHRSETEPNRPKGRPKGILTKPKAVGRHRKKL
jgi:hypothetical protein